MIDIKATLKEIRDQLRQTEMKKASQNAKFDAEIVNLKKVIDGLTALVEEAPLDLSAPSLDSAVLAILFDDRANKLWPKQVCNRLEQKKFDLSQYSNRMAYIHASLIRLAAKGKARREKTKDGSTYQWISTGEQP